MAKEKDRLTRLEATGIPTAGNRDWKFVVTNVFVGRCEITVSAPSREAAAEQAKTWLTSGLVPAES